MSVKASTSSRTYPYNKSAMCPIRSTLDGSTCLMRWLSASAGWVCAICSLHTAFESSRRLLTRHSLAASGALIWLIVQVTHQRNTKHLFVYRTLTPTLAALSLKMSRSPKAVWSKQEKLCWHDLFFLVFWLNIFLLKQRLEVIILPTLAIHPPAYSSLLSFL